MPQLIDRLGQQAACIQKLVLDFDGVLTDNRASRCGACGAEEVVSYSRADGIGIQRLRKAGVDVVILTDEASPVVDERAAKLGLQVYRPDRFLTKYDLLRSIGDKWGNTVAYMGNDLNDMDCMLLARLAACPADAAPEIVRVAHYRTSARGGHGAVRELCDLLIAARADALIQTLNAE